MVSAIPMGMIVTLLFMTNFSLNAFRDSSSLSIITLSQSIISAEQEQTLSLPTFIKQIQQDPIQIPGAASAKVTSVAAKSTNHTSSTPAAASIQLIQQLFEAASVHPTDESQHQEHLIQILQSLDYDTKAICGGYKCFFRIKDNDSVAYLVSIEPIHKEGYQRLNAAYALAKHLDVEYPKITHFLLEPPYQLNNLTEYWATQLNSNLIGQQKTITKWLKAAPEKDPDAKPHHRYGPRYLPNEHIFIQKVQLAPNPYLIIGCEGGKLQETIRDVEKLVKNSVPKKNRKSFLNNLHDNISYIKQVVDQNGNYGCLVWDFQLLLDTSGNLYHIDLDRCFRHVQETYNNKRCFRNLRKVIRRVEEII